MTIQIATKGVGILGKLAKTFFGTPLRAALTAGTAGLYVGSNNHMSYAMNSPAMMQMNMYRGGMGGMGYPGVG